MVSLAGQTVLVTGCASGIGRVLAGTLARDGVRLVLADIDGDLLDRLATELAAAGHPVRAVIADVSRPEDVDRMASAAFEWAGRVDGVVNCAGIYPVTPFLELSAEEWDRVLAVNLRGPFLVTQAVARRMIRTGAPGSIVHISSTASRLARPGIAHYGASKAGLNQLTAISALELAAYQIRVNAILPGVIGTEQVIESLGDPRARTEHEAKLARIPLGRVGQPEDVVNLALFLLSPLSSYCTGGLFTVDGGFTLGIPSYR